MSQFFSLPRFVRLFRKFTAEHLRTYLLAGGVAFGLVALWLSLGVNETAKEPLGLGTQIGAFLAGLGLGGSLLTSSVFASFGDKRQATAALMLPASGWEKFLVGWCYALPVFLLVYVSGFYAVDALILKLNTGTGQVAHLLPLFSTDDKLYLALLAYAVLSSAFLWGSIFFTKQQFLLTAFGLLVGSVLLQVLNYKLVQGLLGRDVDTAMPFSNVTFLEGKQWYSVSLPFVINGWKVMGTALALMLLVWAAAYARLKEKEV
ncbi:hypothetical protein [Hymenobacter properus]|uniref:Uncharacterized protein n=1 Tax=Hymenobacter properus TaxID=2791026 RepID=A0A931BGI8_9BACT|nr:hypothetical protein [Hymenobacter properus]MBF9142056.1 hypothetical protein [Hymenobacter properus]MBR7720863.1 hypothetical protein [Microvirga sp. SRT04]